MLNKFRSISSTGKFILIILIVSVSFLARLVVVFLMGDQKIPFEFGVLVPNLVAGRGYSYYSLDQDNSIKAEYLSNPKAVYPSAFMPPVYPMLLASMITIVRNEKEAVLLLEVLQAIMGTIICLLVYFSTRLLFNGRIAIIALSITSLYPILVYSPSQISTVNISGLFAQLTIFIILLFINNKYRKKQIFISILAGFSLGILILTRSETLLFALLLNLWLFWYLRKKSWKNVLLFSLGTSLVISSWVIRNIYVFGELTPLTISGGYNLWQGQNENASGTFGGYVIPPVTQSEELIKKINDIDPMNTYELIRDKVYQDDALAFIKNHPGKVITLALRKFAYYWGGVYFGFEMNYPGVHSPFILIPWLLLMPFFIVGIIFSFKQWNKYVILYLLLISSTLVSMVFFVLPRYPIFILPTVIMFSSNGIVIFIEKLLKINFFNNMLFEPK